MSWKHLVCAAILGPLAVVVGYLGIMNVVHAVGGVLLILNGHDYSVFRLALRVFFFLPFTLWALNLCIVGTVACVRYGITGVDEG